MRITRCRFARPNDLMPVTEMKPFAIRLAKGKSGTSNCLSGRLQVVTP